MVVVVVDVLSEDLDDVLLIWEVRRGGGGHGQNGGEDKLKQATKNMCTENGVKLRTPGQYQYDTYDIVIYDYRKKYKGLVNVSQVLCIIWVKMFVV